MTPAQLILLKHLRRDGKSLRKCAAIMGIPSSTLGKYSIEFEPLATRLPLKQVSKSIKPYGFVYVFAARDLVKVGMSQHSIYRRWHGIKTANPWLEKPLYVTPALMGRVIEVERACHLALKEFRVTGEWFNCDRQLAIDTVKRISSEL